MKEKHERSPGSPGTYPGHSILTKKVYKLVISALVIITNGKCVYILYTN